MLYFYNTFQKDADDVRCYKNATLLKNCLTLFLS